MSKKKTRGQMDKRYAELSKRSASRSHFITRAMRRWVEENHPQVAVAIRNEAYERYPFVRGNKRQSKIDYSFLRALKAKP